MCSPSLVMSMYVNEFFVIAVTGFASALSLALGNGLLTEEKNGMKSMGEQ